MKKIVILGATGLIGHQVYLRLKAREEFEVFTMARERKMDNETILLDARDEDLLRQKIHEMNPDVIINCMGVLIAKANSDPAHAIFLNAYIPHCLKKVADSLDAKLVHISTDCVFSGSKGSYVETDFKDADDIYGRSKGLGEVTGVPHLTLRTSVVGPELKEGDELFHWFMRQQGAIKGFTKSLWSGVTTVELAKTVEWAVDNDIQGLYQVTNGIPINKYELLMLFKQMTNKDIEIKAVEGRVTNKFMLDTRQELNVPIPSYEGMLREMVSFIKAHPELYASYSL
ncbi:MAG: dTDP-4-dehydrorhamnose reductase [Francisellaceae bacterium]|jgi:dTDP-4-dehydrorhamnose reductase